MDQKTYTKAQDRLEAAIRAFQKLEKESCDKAGNCQLSAEANAKMAKALGYLQLAKGEATWAGNVTPDITPNFGGGK